jgi:hypothetical protein
MNYVDDIDTTLRRITASIPLMDADERHRLADRLREAGGHVNALLGQLEGVAQ